MHNTTYLAPTRHLYFITSTKLINTILDGYVYWSRGEIPSLGVKNEFNRPFLLPKEDYEWDTLSVEATSYALMTYILKEGITIRGEKMVVWLNSMRKQGGGFCAAMVG